MPNIKISDLAPAILPLDGPTSFFEVQTVEAGEDVSRKVASDDLTLAAGITVEDEGVPLATLASTLDFVGAGVTASGAGATKTITIPGASAASLATLTDVSLAGQAQNDLLVNVDGTNWEDTAGKLTYDPVTGAFSIVDPASTDAFTITPDGTNVTLDIGAHTGLNIDDGAVTMLSVDATNGLRVFETGAEVDFIETRHDGTDGNITVFNGLDLNFIGASVGYKFDESIYITEKAAANADFAALGQFWVRNDVPNTPMFTDDAGTDFDLSSVGAPVGASYIVVGVDPTLTNERFLSEGFAINITDNGAGLNILVAWDEAATPVEVTGSWTFNRPSGGTTFGPSNELNFRNQSDDSSFFLQALDGQIQWGIAGGGFQVDFMSFGSSYIYFRFGNPIFIDETAVAVADLTGKGQIWVRDDTPNVLMFTDDAGTDHQIAFV